MAQLSGKVAWITGAGSGIGEAGALALAQAGAAVVLSGRRPDALQQVAATIAAAGGTAHVRPADVTSKQDVAQTVGWLEQELGRIDILVNNAGTNITNRSFATLTADGIDQLIDTNLTAAFYCASAVLPIMRRQQDGVLIHTASWAGRHLGVISGAAYSAAKHAVVVMSHMINEEECLNGIRSSAICPAETATPILDRRPQKVPPEERARMLQPGDLGDLIRYVACLPPHVCMNEVVISPTRNRMFEGVRKAG